MNTTDIDLSDIDDFVSSVDSIAHTITKLKNNTLSQNELIKIDKEIESKRIESKLTKEELYEIEQNKIIEDEKLNGRLGKGISKNYEVYCRLCKLEYIIKYEKCPKCNNKLITQLERETEIYSKIEELKKERAEKAKRKQNYINHKSKNININNTDSKYRAWEYWEPSDSEDELPMADNPSLKVLEKDIEERNKMFEEKKMKSDLEKKLGNDAFKVGKILESITHYSNAIELKKDNKVFYANRASIHLNIFVFNLVAYLKVRPVPEYELALKDCNTALDIWEFLNNNDMNKSILLKINYMIILAETHDIMIKIWLRMSVAYRGLSKYKACLETVDIVLSYTPYNKEAFDLKREVELEFKHVSESNEILKVMNSDEKSSIEDNVAINNLLLDNLTLPELTQLLSKKYEFLTDLNFFVLNHCSCDIRNFHSIFCPVLGNMNSNLSDLTNCIEKIETLLNISENNLLIFNELNGVANIFKIWKERSESSDKIENVFYSWYISNYNLNSNLYPCRHNFLWKLGTLLPRCSYLLIKLCDSTKIITNFLTNLDILPMLLSLIEKSLSFNNFNLSNESSILDFYKFKLSMKTSYSFLSFLSNINMNSTGRLNVCSVPSRVSKICDFVLTSLQYELKYSLELQKVDAHVGIWKLVSASAGLFCNSILDNNFKTHVNSQNTKKSQNIYSSILNCFQRWFTLIPLESFSNKIENGPYVKFSLVVSDWDSIWFEPKTYYLNTWESKNSLLNLLINILTVDAAKSQLVKELDNLMNLTLDYFEVIFKPNKDIVPKTIKRSLNEYVITVAENRSDESVVESIERILGLLLNLSIDQSTNSHYLLRKEMILLQFLSLLSHSNPVIVERSILLIARLCKAKELCQKFLKFGLEKWLTILSLNNSNESTLEGCLRCILLSAEVDPTVLVRVNEFSANSGLSIIIKLLNSKNYLISGNASLFISKLALNEQLLPLLCPSIEPLINLLKSEPKNDSEKLQNISARKNAAMCLAKLSKYPQYLDKIRELRGIEMMIAYAKMIL